MLKDLLRPSQDSTVLADPHPTARRDPVPRTALVTGGARRIGSAIVRDLAAHGWDVAIHCRRSANDAEKVAAEITAAGRRAVIITGDLAEAEAIPSILDAAIDGLGPISLLVNNAAVYLRDQIGMLDADLWHRQFAVNLQAPVFLAEAFARRLPQHWEANIINIIDQRVWRITPKMTSYTLSKSALWTATQIMAQALAPRVRVNAIAPGPTLPNEQGGHTSFAAEVAGLPLRRTVELSEFGRAIRFLVESPSITGQMVALDAGQHLAWQTPDVVHNGE